MYYTLRPPGGEHHRPTNALVTDLFRRNLKWTIRAAQTASQEGPARRTTDGTTTALSNGHLCVKALGSETLNETALDSCQQDKQAARRGVAAEQEWTRSDLRLGDKRSGVESPQPDTTSRANAE